MSLSSARIAELKAELEAEGYTVTRHPCPEGFHWIGQTFKSRDKCGLPAWEHKGEARIPKDINVFSEFEWELHPWGPGEAERMKARWDR